MTTIDPNQLEELELLQEHIVELFGEGDWAALAVITSSEDIINKHPRLLRSEHFGDEDYSGHVLDVLIQIAKRDVANIEHIRRRVAKLHGIDGVNTSSTPAKDRPTIVFTPTQFDVPNAEPNQNLISVMMPFNASFTAVYDVIKSVARNKGLDCNRADDIWDDSVVVQDIFSLIYRSYIVVCDFTERNPNVFYEAGIAHTLGKHVIPITQNSGDIPFNLRHHRFVSYLDNSEGREALATQLEKRIGNLLVNRLPWVF